MPAYNSIERFFRELITDKRLTRQAHFFNQELLDLKEKSKAHGKRGFGPTCSDLHKLMSKYPSSLMPAYSSRQSLRSTPEKPSTSASAGTRSGTTLGPRIAPMSGWPASPLRSGQLWDPPIYNDLSVCKQGFDSQTKVPPYTHIFSYFVH